MPVPKTALMCALGLALLAPVAQAQRVEGERAVASGAYATEVAVRNQGNAERNGAFSRALLKVLTNLSGERNPIARPGVADEIRNAGAYVAGYDYRQDEGLSASGAPTFKTTLVVRFNPAKVDGLVAKTGMASWPEPRPKPVLWLAIDDGSGPRLVSLGQANAARPVLDRAKARGYRLGLPAGSAAEQAMAGAIWRGDTAAITRASAAYSPPIQLIGKLYRNGPAWRADWVFQDRGRVLARTTTSNGDARLAMAGGADIAADALLRRYARPGRPVAPPPRPATPAAPPPLAVEDVGVTLTGIDSSAEYVRAMAWLDAQAAVKRITIVSAEGPRLTLRLGVAGGAAALAKLTAGSNVLTAPVPAPAPADAPPEAPAPAPVQYDVQ